MVFGNQRRMRGVLFGLITLFVSCAVRGQPLALKKAHTLQVMVGDKVFVSEDALSLAELSKAQLQSFSDVGAWKEVTVLKGGSKKNCIYYRETACKPGRIEVTWYIKYAPYQFGKDFPGHSYNLGGASYAMKMPAAFLDGATYKAVTGNLLRPTIKEGRLDTRIKDGELILSSLRYITFTKDGRSVTLDLNPVGPHNFGQKTMLAERDWRLSRDGRHFVLWSNMTKVKWGALRQFKVVITPGPWAYEEVHTANKRGHIPYVFASRRINFGPKPLRRHEKADCSAYTLKRGHGWRNAGGLAMVTTGFADPLKGDYVQGGPERRTFLIDSRNGVYLVNLVFGSSTDASGPFSVHANGQLRLKGLRTAKGDFIAKTLHTRAAKGRIALTFEGGPWMLNALSVVPLITDEEDFLFKRTWWIQQSRFDDWFAEVEPIPPMPPIIHKTKSADPMAWAWNASLESLEASLDSNRAALDTPETVAHRLRLIKSGGFKGLIINGLHFRYNHKDSAKKKVMFRNTRLAVETAHKMGIKVIDHWDFNWVFYTGYPAMLEVLAEDPDCLQRHVDPLRLTMSFCLNSKVFVDQLKQFLVEEQKATDLDGYMLDEVAWVRADFCLCDTCRRLFRKETGLRLPHTAIGGFVDNQDHPLWRAFVTWRGRKEREVFASLLAEVRTVRPDVVFLRYRSEEFSRPHRTGLELNRGMPWGVDYVGDEYHPDDILMNWRMMFARLKNAQGIVSSYGNYPTWSLPRNLSHKTPVLYAWAICRMHRSNLWYRSWDRAHSLRLHTWRWQMKDALARPVSEVAVVLSQATRDFRKAGSYYHEEYAAWLQTMAEESIQYDVILERDISAETLKPYKVLLLANVAVLSDRQAEVIEGFAASGGSVVAIFETGLFDEKYGRREDSVFADAMNVEKLGYVPWKTELHLCPELAKGMTTPRLDVAAKSSAYRVKDKKRSRVLADLFDPVKEKKVVPAIVETAFGKGRFYYLAGNFLHGNYEPRMASPKNVTFIGRGKTKFPYPTHMNRELNKLVKNLIAMAIGEDYRTRAVRMPDKVIYTAFEQNDNGRRALLIHFLNCRGRPDLKFGDPLKLLDPVPQPPLPHDVVLQIRSTLPITNAFLVAPLREGRVAVGLEREGPRTYAVTVPATAIENYAILYLEKAE